MFSEFIAKIEAHYTKDLPFVVYRKPNMQTVKVILQNDAEVNEVIDFTEEGFVFSPFTTAHKTVLIKQDVAFKTDVESSETIVKKPSNFLSGTMEAKALHLNLVAKGITAIKNDRFKKVVLSRVVKENSKTKPLSVFETILNTYPTAFCYFWHHPKIGTWLGATPETLIKIENGRLVTNALAGTQLYVENETPVWGEKEKEEQALVTQYILKALADNVLGLSVSETETIKAGSILHLKTKITGSVKEKDLQAIVSKLHPTPAVCGLPKVSSEKFIIENENYDREYYTGFLGELNLKTKIERTKGRRNIENKAYQSIKKSTEFYVNLRCMQLKENIAHIYVGGGITKDSVPEKEWEETVNKSTTMLKVIS